MGSYIQHFVSTESTEKQLKIDTSFNNKSSFTGWLQYNLNSYFLSCHSHYIQSRVWSEYTFASDTADGNNSALIDSCNQSEVSKRMSA